ncbi:hypothetical protein B0T25DRAFT_547279 [Lasiosphaeria hispida]|uniref:Uncharacterized protein n=1 Tax=Lasiosphaeria hispida TaxID=260671 RepID=A0AAJ0HEE7_9PEZI|nr:hypothetical protein B0T25DRAFT_547279 [Lasiosphaeria hispida]
MDTSSLIAMVGDGPNRPLIDSISRINSQILGIQQREFHTALGSEGDSEIVCFYETVESPTAQETNGKWEMTRPAVTLTLNSLPHRYGRLAGRQSAGRQLACRAELSGSRLAELPQRTCAGVG